MIASNLMSFDDLKAERTDVVLGSMSAEVADDLVALRDLNQMLRALGSILVVPELGVEGDSGSIRVGQVKVLEPFLMRVRTD